MDDRGIVYVAFGERAKFEASRALASLRLVHRRMRVVVMGPAEVANGRKDWGTMSDVQRSRYAKTRLDRLTPFAQTLYMDADTRVYAPITAGFDALDAGWDLVITTSDNQGDDVLWHIGGDERWATLEGLGRVPLQLQGGIFWFKRSERVRSFFDAWAQEWDRWQDQDQAALLRALERVPLRTWLMGRPFNGGAVVGHRFGMAR